jgi:hypothetical protein
MEPTNNASAAPQALEPNNSPKPTRALDTIRAVVSTLGVIIAALAIAFCLTVFVFQSYQVDGPSIFPTAEILSFSANQAWLQPMDQPNN